MEVEVETDTALGSGGGGTAAISTRAALCAAAFNVLVHLTPLLVRSSSGASRLCGDSFHASCALFVCNVLEFNVMSDAAVRYALVPRRPLGSPARSRRPSGCRNGPGVRRVLSFSSATPSACACRWGGRARRVHAPRARAPARAVRRARAHDARPVLLVLARMLPSCERPHYH